MQNTAYDMRISDWSSDVCSSDLAAHALDRDIAGQDEQVGPADLVAIFLLDRPQQASRLVEISVVGPAVERRETLLPAVGAAATVGGAIGARGVPCHEIGRAHV